MYNTEKNLINFSFRILKLNIYLYFNNEYIIETVSPDNPYNNNLIEFRFGYYNLT